MRDDQTGDLPRDLGAGLVLRRSTAADASALASFNKVIHRDPDLEEPDDGIAAWTRELLSGDHPTFGAGDFTVVEEVATGRIISCSNLISQTWTYSGIPFGVGRIELVGTDPGHRSQGLVRRQFELLHAWSCERGQLAQAITGIPYFYRQFGYEMALVLGGSRACGMADVPPLKPGRAEPYALRQAAEADLSFLVALDAYAAQRSLVYCPRDERLWRYELSGRDAASVNRLAWWIITTASGSPVGALGCVPWVWKRRLIVPYLELAPGISWLATADSILRAARGLGQAQAGRENKPVDTIAMALGIEHPIYRAARDRLPAERRPYAWYLRVPDLPGFVRRIASVLEQRLAASIAANHGGELKLSFYRDGLRLVFESGRLVEVAPWMPDRAAGDYGAAGFPGLAFLQLLFGYRALEELRAAFPDCWVSGDEAYALLEILFPKQVSRCWAIT